MDKHREPSRGRYDSRLGSFYDRIQARKFAACHDRDGNLLNHAGGRGKTVDAVPHTQAVKGIVMNPKTGELTIIQTG